MALELGAGEGAVEHRLDDRSPGEAVGRGDEVERCPHQSGADDCTVDEELGKGGGLIRVEPGPESNVGGERLLGLQASQMGNRGGNGHVRALKQQLPGKKGAIDGTARKQWRRSQVASSASGRW